MHGAVIAYSFDQVQDFAPVSKTRLGRPCLHFQRRVTDSRNPCAVPGFARCGIAPGPDFAPSPRLTHAQAEVLGERIEIPIVVQQVIPAFDASGCNHSIDRLANGHAEPAQRAEILRRLNRDFLPAQLHHRSAKSAFPGVIEVSFVYRSLAGPQSESSRRWPKAPGQAASSSFSVCAVILPLK
jgi:hypothetical protein